MKHAEKNKKGSMIEIEVQLTKEEFREYWDKHFDVALSQVELKGFRKGTAPRNIAEQAVNQEKVFQEASQDAVRLSLNHINEEKGWILIDQPVIEITSADNGLAFKGVLTIFPEIEIADYKKIAHRLVGEAQKNNKDILNVNDEEINQSIRWLQNSRATTVAVNRPAQKKDVVELSFDTFIEDKPLDQGKVTKDQFILGEGKFLPGFEDKLIGLSTNDIFDIVVEAPADYWKEELRGKTLRFKGKILTIFERTVPELNDDFAISLGNFKNIIDLNEKLKEGIINEKRHKENEKTRIAIIEEIIEKTTADIPDVMIEKTLDQMVKQEQNNIERVGKNANEIRKEWRDIARKKVLSHLVIHTIAQREHLEPTKEEVETELQKHQRHTEMSHDTFYDYVFGTLQNRKVFEFLERA